MWVQIGRVIIYWLFPLFSLELSVLPLSVGFPRVVVTIVWIEGLHWVCHCSRIFGCIVRGRHIIEIIKVQVVIDGDPGLGYDLLHAYHIIVRCMGVI